MGHGWTHIYNTFVQEHEDGSVTELDPQGAHLDFTKGSGGSYISPHGNRDTLTKNSDGTFKLK